MKEENQQLWIILLIVFIGFVGTSVAYPIFPPLFLHPSHDSLIPFNTSTSTRSILLGVALAAYPLGQFIGSLILGGCSDHYGRKKVLMLSLGGSALGYLLTMISLSQHALWLLLFSRFLTGGMEGNLSIVRAMATDLKSINKFKSLGKINAMASIGYVTGPLFGGFLSDNHLVPWFSFTLPFLIATVFVTLAIPLAAMKLSEKKPAGTQVNVSMLERFNVFKRIYLLFNDNPALKHLLIISTVFTFAVDIFYEFSPVYLTGLWAVTPAGIAIYNTILCVTLAMGGFLPHYFSKYLSLERVVMVGMLSTALFFGLLVLFPSKLVAFLLFGVLGISISMATTNLTIQVAMIAHKGIQGEAMGAQLSLRMLGDASICLLGGFLIISSVMLPMAICSVVAFGGWLLYKITFVTKG